MYTELDSVCILGVEGQLVEVEIESRFKFQGQFGYHI